MGTLSAPFWCLCQKLSLSPLYFNKTYTLIKLYYTKALSNQASSLAPDWILLLWGPRIPVSSWFNNNLSVTDFLSLGSKITVDGDCRLEIRKQLLLGRKAMTNLVQFSRSVVSDSLQAHGLQHARPSCPSPTPRAYSNSCPLSWWCHPTILSSVSPSPPAFNLCQHQGLSNELALCIRWPKYCSFRFSIMISLLWIKNKSYLQALG